MKLKAALALFITLVMLLLTVGCNLNPQSSKEKMAYNNFHAELKASNMMGGKVGNPKYLGNAVEFDITDPNLEKAEIQNVMGHVITMYVNNNNSAGTGITTLKAYAKVKGKRVLRCVYNAGPSHDIKDNLKFIWEDGS